MYCPNCGSSNKEGAGYCKKCGGKLASSALQAAETARLHSEEVSLEKASQQKPAGTDVCPSCGYKNKPGAAFCGSCGVNLLELPASDTNTRPVPTGRNQRLFIIITAAAIFVAIAGAAAVGAYLYLSKGNDSSPAINALEANSNSSSSGIVPTTNSILSSHAADTSLTGNSTQAQSYVSSVDALIAKNTQLEEQIVSTANQINSVGPNIDNSIINSTSDLENEFKALESNVNRLSPPNSFSQTQSDFIKLINYNVTRSDSLYRGAVAWRSHPNDSSFNGIFMEGQQAKESYQNLYPIFMSEYQNAKGT